MKPLVLLGVSMLTGFLVGCAGLSREGSYTPTSGFVPDAKTAESIAEAVWGPIYGAKEIEDQKPFQTKLVGRTWVVEGYLDVNPAPGVIVIGGTAYIEIDKKSGRIIYVSHGE